MRALYNNPVLIFAVLAVTILVTAETPFIQEKTNREVVDSGARQPRVCRGYVDMRWGQLHYIMATPAVPRADQKTPIVMLHQSPNSSADYAALVPEMGRDRIAIAVDTPGHGGSDGPNQILRIEDYALAIAEGLKGLGFSADRRIDILGRFTGALIGVEVAINEPKMVRRVALLGIYVPSEERREKWRQREANLVHPKTSAEAFEQFCQALPRSKEIYLAQGIPDSVWGRMRVESLRSLTRIQYAHAAAFRYHGQVSDRLPKVSQPVLLMAWDDDLYQETKDSQSLFKNAELIDLPQYKSGALYSRAAEIAAMLRKSLD